MLEVHSGNFDAEVSESKIPVAVKFWAPWCGPCTQLAPIFESVSKGMEGKMKFTSCNIDVHSEFAQSNGVMSIPCIIVFKDGKESGRIVGGATEDSLKQQLMAFL